MDASREGAEDAVMNASITPNSPSRSGMREDRAGPRM